MQAEGGLAASSAVGQNDAVGRLNDTVRLTQVRKDPPMRLNQQDAEDHESPGDGRAQGWPISGALETAVERSSV